MTLNFPPRNPYHKAYLRLLSLGWPQLEQSLDLSRLDLEDLLFDSFLESFLEPLLEPLELVRGRWDLCVWLGSELVLISRERLELPLSLPPLPREALELDLGF